MTKKSPKTDLVIRQEWPRVRKVLNYGLARFCVDSRRTGFANGKREFFDNSEDALQSARRLASQIRSHGISQFEDLSPGQRRDATEALEELAAFDEALPRAHSPLLDAVRTYVSVLAEKRKQADAPLVENCLEAYLSAKRAEHEEFERTAGKSGIARTTLYELEKMGRIFRDHFGSMKITELDRKAVEQFLKRLKVAPRTKINIKTKLSQFMGFCRSQPGSWITANPVDGIEIKITGDEVKILSVEAIERLLRAAERSENPASVLPYLLVSTFAGLRPGEAQQLRWESIHFETGQLEVRGVTSKARETRYVDLEPVLSEWLLAYRHARGRILGHNFVAHWAAVREHAGFSFGDDDSNPWTPDILRHCYGSYWLAVHGDRAKLAELMGNSVEVIKRNYRKAVPRRIAEAFWALRPLSSKGKIITLPAAS